MSFSELNNMMQSAVESLKNMLDADTVVGTSISAGDSIVIPINRISAGFVTGGYDMKSKVFKVNSEPSEQPIAAMGGGVTITPLGFLTVSEGKATFIKTQGDGTDKWLDIIQSTIKKQAK
ncbi:MAG: spore germination protein GerW family protein [Clostridia bacterium]